jgi:hypothetical protein
MPVSRRDKICNEYDDRTERKKAVYLSEEDYAKAIESFVILSADILPVNLERRTIYLAKRCVEPMPNWWVFGGRILKGESFEEAAIRHLEHDAQLVIATNRLHLLNLPNRYFWARRKQEPQEVGSDNLSFTFTFEITEKEFKVARKHLNREEYYKGAFKEFTHDELLATPNIHNAIFHLYRQIFF